MKYVMSLWWMHKQSGCAYPCKSDLSMAAKEDALRTIGHSVSTKEPFTVDMLKSIVYLYGHEKSNLNDVRTACMCLLNLCGFFCDSHSYLALKGTILHFMTIISK